MRVGTPGSTRTRTRINRIHNLVELARLEAHDMHDRPEHLTFQRLQTRHLNRQRRKKRPFRASGGSFTRWCQDELAVICSACCSSIFSASRSIAGPTSVDSSAGSQCAALPCTPQQVEHAGAISC